MKIWFVLLLFSFTLHARIYEINKDHSRVSFSIPYMSVSDVEGHFASYVGDIDFDSQSKELTSIKVRIHVNSINTSDRKRDKHLRGSEFFYSSKFPKINFTSTHIVKTKPGSYKVEGDLEIKGIIQNVILKVDYIGEKRDHAKKENLFFKATTKLNRKDFNILWNKSIDKNEYLIGDEVRINISIQAQPGGKKTAFSTHMIPDTKALEDIAQKNRERISLFIPQASAQTTNIKAQTGFSFWKMFIGFIGFCMAIVVSYYIKSSMTKVFNKPYTEGSMVGLFGDTLVVCVTFAYAYWYFLYLYPN